MKNILIVIRVQGGLVVEVYSYPAKNTRVAAIIADDDNRRAGESMCSECSVTALHEAGDGIAYEPLVMKAVRKVSDANSKSAE